jgi:SAM-dependent methyltransferase
MLSKIQVRQGFTNLRPEELVTAAYRALLLREPDPAGLKHYSDALRGGYDATWLLQSLLRSEEFGRSASEFPLDAAPPVNIQTNATVQERRALWDHVASVWSNLGRVDPYWSVLTDARWRAKNMKEQAVIETFYGTGKADLLRLEAWMHRNAIKPDPDAICAEYGCGLGRVTRWLATRFRKVIAFDISEPHLKAARSRLCAEGINNIDFILVRGDADLRMLADIDLFYSVIVLQHNPPPIIMDILAAAFHGLKPGGVCFFQLPTYAANYSFSVATYLKDSVKSKKMEMHCLPQRLVLEQGRRYGVVPIEIQFDGAAGDRSRWISNTFLMTKTL